ncbi:hypothetical protein HRI_003432300 [Hibiscus trionum]|nr:hypothetical protein HRI_003432300 [Hibiscus trionum]
MKPSQYLPFSLLVLFIFFSSTVQGIRLEKSFKSMENSNGVIGDVILCRQGHCTGTQKRTFSTVLRKSHHWLPSIHEDYYGPRKHRPKHH